MWGQIVQAIAKNIGEAFDFTKFKLSLDQENRNYQRAIDANRNNLIWQKLHGNEQNTNKSILIAGAAVVFCVIILIIILLIKRKK